MLKNDGEISIGWDSSIFNILKVRDSIEIFYPIFIFRKDLPRMAKPTQRYNGSRSVGKRTVYAVAR